MTKTPTIVVEDLLKKLIEASENVDYQAIAGHFSKLHPGEVARLLEAAPPKDRSRLWTHIDADMRGNILIELGSEVQSQLIDETDTQTLVESLDGVDTDDLADIVVKLPESIRHNLLLTLDLKHRQSLRKALSYPDNSAGGLMNTDIITVRSNVTVRTVIRYLRLLREMPADTDQIFVVDKNYHYLGSLHIATLLTEQPETDIQSLMKNSSKPIPALMPAAEVAQLFEERNLISAPVVDDKNELIGRITIDDVVDVIREEAEHSLMSMAGLDETEDVFSPVIKSAKERSIWLGVNLITAFIAVFFIGLFEATLMQKIALAILMPVVASMGGIAGMQTLVLVTRGIATGRVGVANIRTLMNKEVMVGFLSGIFWALVIALATYLWFTDFVLSAVIGAAVVANLIFATFSGAFLPIMLSKLKIDPALAGGVILTTITDVIGFVAFLGLATLFI